MASHLSRLVESKKHEQLLRGIKNRDSQTLKAVYKEFYPKVARFIAGKGGSAEDAKDIFQESLMVVYKLSLSDQLTIETDFGNYLIGIAKRIYFKQIRQKEIHHRYVDGSEKTFSEDHPSDVEIENEIEQHLIRNYLLKLGEICQKILLWSSSGIDNEEIAAKLGYKSEKIVRTKKHKCKSSLIAMIKEDPFFKGKRS